MTASQTRGYALVAMAAGLWGTLGLFFRVLHDDYQFSGLTLAFLRAGIAAVLLIAFIVATRPDLLRISGRSLVLFIVYGLAGVAAFYFFYVQAVIQTSVTTAVVLLYTAPAFVTLMAWRIWREPMTHRKLAALGLAFIGSALVARAYDPSQLVLNLVGIGLGLGAGLTYALYTIISKYVLERHSNWTALPYALAIGALFLAPLQTRAGLAPLGGGWVPWLLLLGLALGPTLGSLVLYNTGLQDVPASNASLVAMLEPVVASVLAFVVLGERLEIWQLIGGALVIGGAVLVNSG